MQIPEKHAKLIKKIQDYRKANSETTLKDCLKATKIAPWQWTSWVSKGWVERTRPPRWDRKAKPKRKYSKRPKHQIIETALPETVATDRLCVVMGTVAQVKSLIKEL